MPRKKRDKFVFNKKKEQEVTQPTVSEPVNRKRERRGKLYDIYHRHYKTLLIIPALMLLLAIIAIGVQVATTGDFINRGVSLKGGITLTVLSDKNIDVNDLEATLSNNYPNADITIRSLERSAKQIGFLIEATINDKDSNQINQLIEDTRNYLGVKEMDYSLETIGSALGASFFIQTLYALIIAFIFMAVVVWFYFRIPVPSAAVILAAFSDMVVTLAIVNLIGMKLSTAGIAAFLMLIGYSVDTDILLSTRVLKHSGGTVLDRALSAMKTGLTMNLTTLAAVLVSLIFAQSDILRQIMTILLIGLLVDIINTWIQNAGILRWYLEKHHVDIKKLD